MDAARVAGVEPGVGRAEAFGRAVLVANGVGVFAQTGCLLDGGASQGSQRGPGDSAQGTAEGRADHDANHAASAVADRSVPICGNHFGGVGEGSRGCQGQCDEREHAFHGKS